MDLLICRVTTTKSQAFTLGAAHMDWYTARRASSGQRATLWPLTPELPDQSPLIGCFPPSDCVTHSNYSPAFACCWAQRAAERSGRNGMIRFWSKDIKEQSAFTQEVYLSNLCFFLFYPILNFHHCMLTFKCTGVFQAYTCLPLVFNDNISKHTHKKIIFLQLIFKCICIWTTKPTVFKFLLCEPDE